MKRKIVIPILLLLMLCLIGCKSAPEYDETDYQSCYTPGEENRNGNSVENLRKDVLNTCWATSQGEYIYYATLSYIGSTSHGYIYKENVNTKESSVIYSCLGEIQRITVYKDYIYFINKGVLYKLKADGETIEPFHHDGEEEGQDPEYFYDSYFIEDGKIIVIKSEMESASEREYNLVEIDLDDLTENEIAALHDFDYLESRNFSGHIPTLEAKTDNYYVILYRDKNNFSEADFVFIDKNGWTISSSLEPSYYFSVDSGNYPKNSFTSSIKFYGDSMFIYNGKSIIEVTIPEFVSKERELPDYLQNNLGNIYMKSKDEIFVRIAGSLYKTSINGLFDEEFWSITDDGVGSMCIIEGQQDYIYYYSNEYYCRIDTDGNNWEILEKEHDWN